MFPFDNFKNSERTQNTFDNFLYNFPFHSKFIGEQWNEMRFTGFESQCLKNLVNVNELKSISKSRILVSWS